MLHTKVPWDYDFRRIADYALQYINEEAVDRTSKMIGDNHIIQKRIHLHNLPDWFKNFSDLEPEVVQIFAAKPNTIGKYHKDGLDRKVAFNIPLRGCEEGSVEWCEESNLNEYRLSNLYTKIRLCSLEQGKGNFRLDLPVRDSLVLEQPSILNTDEWHRVNNSTNQNYRFALSFRFKGNPTFAEVQEALCKA